MIRPSAASHSRESGTLRASHAIPTGTPGRESLAATISDAPTTANGKATFSQKRGVINSAGISPRTP